MATPGVDPALEQRLIDLMGRCSRDPLLFVQISFPWAVGELDKFDGPDEWQTQLLADVRDGLRTISEAIQIARASGHGIGKSALVAWLILWALSTKADTKGVVTANTEAQLRTKTWPELAKWHRLFIAKHWFKLEATSLFSTQLGNKETWRVDAIAWSEKNSEAFAGLHNKGKRVLLIFDEASAISDTIWEVAEGALTDEDTERLWFAFGNPTRAKGRFKDCFGRFKHRWNTKQIDSRSVAITNKAQLQAWIDDYGIESDFVKVRVLGQFPSADVNALFSEAEVDAAMCREPAKGSYQHGAKIIGVDVARQGMDDSVIAYRQAHLILPVKRMHVPDTQLVARIVAQAIQEYEADGTLVDSTGGYGAGVVDGLRQMGYNPIEVYFSGKADDARYFNKRSEMAFLFLKWVQRGGCLPYDAQLREEMLAQTYSYSGDKFRLCEKEEVREEIGRSPDAFDACATTFAAPIAPKLQAYIPVEYGGSRQTVLPDYDPFAALR